MFDMLADGDMLVLLRKKHKKAKSVDYETPFGWLMLAAALIMIFLSFKLTDSMSEDKKKTVQGIFLFIAVVLLVASHPVDKMAAKK